MKADFRQQPQNIEAEQAVLSSCFLDPYSLTQALEILNPDDFYRTAHQKIFESMAALNKKGGPADLVTVTEDLQKRGNIEKAGGATYLSKIFDAAPMAVNINSYARIVKEAATRRAIISVSNKTIEACYSEPEMSDVLDRAQSDILGIDFSSLDDCIIPMSRLIEERYDHWETISKNPGTISGIPSGLDIDRVTGGFQNTDLIIIAARPGMGKTALAMTMMGNMAAKEYGCGFFSLEMSSEQLMDRWASMESRIDGFRFKKGLLKDFWEKVSQAANRFYEYRIFIDDTAGLSYQEVRRRARRMKKINGIDILFIDYLQLMAGDKSEGRTREIGSITRNMKAMAKELNIPVILLSQLSRAVEQRPNKRPILSDLRDSGEIEQDADLVLFIYRDEVNSQNEKNPNNRGIAEIDVKKHRNGPNGMVKLSWVASFTRFENMAKHVG